MSTRKLHQNTTDHTTTPRSWKQAQNSNAAHLNARMLKDCQSKNMPINTKAMQTIKQTCS